MGEEKVTIFDLDDFAYNNHNLKLLDALMRATPKLRVTLFVVPFPHNGTSPDKDVRQWLSDTLRVRPWIEYALHGFHHTFKECQGWDKARAGAALDWAEDTGIFVKGFKGPYWAMSPGTYEALGERGWWVADHPDNNAMRPAGLKCHLLGTENIVHGHVQDIGSNGLREQFERYASMKPPFRFVSEVMR